MSFDVILNFILFFGVYIAIGMMVAIFVNDMDYFVGDYYLLVTLTYPIIILILLYFDLRRLLEEIKNLRRY